MTISLRHEAMNDAFHKWHVEGLPFPASIHHFTAPDHGDPHDHPFGFTTHILSGGYVEEVWERYTRRTAWGDADEPAWRSTRHLRKTGTSHRVEATHIHLIIELPAGECWTIMLPDQWERTPRFWRFDHGAAQSRAWNEADWTAE